MWGVLGLLVLTLGILLGVAFFGERGARRSDAPAKKVAEAAPDEKAVQPDPEMARLRREVERLRREASGNTAATGKPGHEQSPREKPVRSEPERQEPLRAQPVRKAAEPQKAERKSPSSAPDTERESRRAAPPSILGSGPARTPDHVWTPEDCKRLANRIYADKRKHGPRLLDTGKDRDKKLVDALAEAHSWALTALLDARGNKDVTHTRAETALILWNKFRKAVELPEEAAKGEPVPRDLLTLFDPGAHAGWTIETTVARSPSPPPAGSAVILSGIRSRHDAEIRVEVRRPDTASQAAVIFGATGLRDYFLLDVTFFGGGTECGAVAYHWKAPELKELASTRFHLTKAQRSGWLPYVVRTEGRRATFFLGRAKLFSVACGRFPRGRIGMHVSAVTKYRGQVLYRRLAMRRLAKTRKK